LVGRDAESPEWTNLDHDVAASGVFFDFTMLPPGCGMTSTVEVLSRDAYVPDADLTVTLISPDGLLKSRGEKVTWK
jgi:hypothetical protein